MRITTLDSSPDELADPAAPAWEDIPGELLPLVPAPVSGQPSHYVRSVYAATPAGHTRQLEARIARCGGELLIRLDWADETENRRHENRAFPDAAAVMFPANGDAQLETMGTPEHPVDLWYWRSDLDGESDSLRATGVGTVERTGANGLSAQSKYEEGRWSVVLRRTAAPDSEKIALAVWDGAAGERAGLKSVSRGWHPLEDGEGGGR